MNALFDRVLSSHFSMTNYTFYENTFYVVLHGDRGNVSNFQASCEKLGGYLVEFNTAKEYDDMMNFMQNSPKVNGQIVLIGYSDAGLQGMWYYMKSAKIATYTRWASGEPNEPNKDCAYVNPYDDPDTGFNKMKDIRCDIYSQYNFLCEIPDA